MKLRRSTEFYITHILAAVLVLIVCLAPKKRPTTAAPFSLLVTICIIEAVFLLNLYARRRKGRSVRGAMDIMIIIWAAMIVWELVTAVCNVAHPVLIPAPENVFDTFRLQWRIMLLNVAYSLELLGIGFGIGMAASVFLGLAAGWFPRAREITYPIANVMAPIPAIVFSPYLVALMPTFRSASALVIILGVFWPTFLTTVNRVVSIDSRTLDSARMLNLSNGTMIGRILLPYIMPGIVGGLKVSTTTSLLMLNFAELMGATHGMGFFIQNSITYANYAHAIAGIICIGVVVTGLNYIVTLVQRHAIRWK